MMDVDDDFVERSNAFVDWLRSSGAKLSDKIEIADLRQQHAGRGVVAISDIGSDEELFSIPRSVLLNTKNSDLSTQQPNLLESAAGEPWLALILTMLYEDGKSDSKWRCYFNILPAQGQFDTLMYWDEAELKELEASAVVNKIGKESADKSFREKIWPVVQQNPQLFGFKNDVIEHEVLAAAHRMGSLIMAYAFDIESEREKEIDEEGYVSDEDDEDMPKAMVPLADVLNADADRSNARLFYEPDVLVMKAVTPIAKGEEIFTDHGPLPRSDVLRRYGYITDNYAQYDVVEVSSASIMSAAKLSLKLSNEEIEKKVGLLSEFDEVLEDGYDISRPSPNDDIFNVFSPGLKFLIALLTLPTASLPPATKPSRVEKAIARNEFSPEWHTFILDVLEARLAEYGSTLDEDKQHLEVYKQRIQSGMWLTNQQETQRRSMALSVRVGEKEILEHAIAVVKDKQLLDTGGKTGGTGGKRKANGSNSGTLTPKRTRR